MTGNGSLSEKIKKLLKHCSLGNLCCIIIAEHTLEHEEHDIRQAAKEFEIVKVSKLKMQTLHAARNDDFGSDRKWGVAESWSQHVIGQLAHGFGSLDILLELIASDQEVYKSSQLKESSEMKSCSCKGKLSDEGIVLFEDPHEKRLKEIFKSSELDSQGSQLDENIHDSGVNGHVIVDRVWRKIREEEIFAIQSAIRIMV